MDASANGKQQWTPEVAARLRGVVIAFVVLLLLSMVITIAYVAGRTMSAAAVPSPVYAAPAKSPDPAPAPAQPLSARRVEPPLPVPVPRQAALVPKETVKQVADPTSHTPAVDASVSTAAIGEKEGDSETRIPVPQPGLYLQVGAVDLASAERMVQTINRNGLAAVIAPGPSKGIFRVVVGPLDSAETAAPVRAVLVEKGYQTFPRRY